MKVAAWGFGVVSEPFVKHFTDHGVFTTPGTKLWSFSLRTRLHTRPIVAASPKKKKNGSKQSSSVPVDPSKTRLFIIRAGVPRFIPLKSGMPSRGNRIVHSRFLLFRLVGVCVRAQEGKEGICYEWVCKVWCEDALLFFCFL